MTSKSLSAKSPKIVEGLVAEAGKRMPNYKKQIDTVGPYIVQAADLCDAAFPYVVAAWRKGWQTWDALQPYNPQQYGPMLMGLIMCFFGGSYVTLIAAVEAVRMSVWQNMWEGFQGLYRNYLKAEEASRKDDEEQARTPLSAPVAVDAVLSRKLYLFARTVDPYQVSDSTAAIWGALLAIVATLRVHFARAITLGSSLGDMAHNHLTKSTTPILQQAIPPELQRWVPVIDGFLFKLVGVLAAWFLSRLIAGFHAAMKGANMFVINAIRLARARGFVDEHFDENSPRASALAVILAVLGFYWQLSNGFSVPFPLNVVLLPVTMVEWLLAGLVGFA